MRAAGAGRVIACRHPDFRIGDAVTGVLGVQEYAIAQGKSLTKIDTRFASMPVYLGTLGLPGMTAYFGLLDIGKPQPGQTVVVSGAAGAVGTVAGQIAKIKGCRAVGIAGGPDKCRFLVDELGFDAAIDYRAKDLVDQLAAACPRGIDVYFENVGGAVWEAVFPLLNDFARVPVCGLIAHYNDTELTGGFPTARLMRAVLTKRLTIRGFIVRDFVAHAAEFERDVSQWLREGKIKYREDVVEGIEKAPQAFMGLLQGKNFGKLLVRVAKE